MDSPEIKESTRHHAALESEVRRLRNELDTLRRSTFTSIRDRELQHQTDKNILKEAHELEMRRLTTQFDEERSRTAAAADAVSVEALVRDAREQWEIEFQTLLARAADDWADAERERTAKIRVELDTERRAAVEERDAYWQAKFREAPLSPNGQAGSRPFAEHRQKIPSTTGTEAHSNKIPHPGTLAVLVGMLLLIAVGYLFAPQWQPLAKATMQSALSGAAGDTQQLIDTVAPWLKSEGTPETAMRFAPPPFLPVRPISLPLILW
jgi:hypothetical protein